MKCLWSWLQYGVQLKFADKRKIELIYYTPSSHFQVSLNRLLCLLLIAFTSGRGNSGRREGMPTGTEEAGIRFYCKSESFVKSHKFKKAL